MWSPFLLAQVCGRSNCMTRDGQPSQLFRSSPAGRGVGLQRTRTHLDTVVPPRPLRQAARIGRIGSTSAVEAVGVPGERAEYGCSSVEERVEVDGGRVARWAAQLERWRRAEEVEDECQRSDELAQGQHLRKYAARSFFEAARRGYGGRRERVQADDGRTRLKSARLPPLGFSCQRRPTSYARFPARSPQRSQVARYKR